ncbi:MAG: FAD-dependent oxidoreductase, partial [Parasphingopyxis sp.]
MADVDEVECVVIGAGVVGLACAAAIAKSGREVLVLEAENAIGMHSS